ncbi:MAG: CvpA family protein [Gammaproteobacteria bacterium]|nr:MAG: CvpA family protein [Gammaproteobacteria bacterium]
MVWIDITILVILGVSVLISVIRGFVKEAMSLIVWIAAFWVAITFSVRLSGVLSQWVSDPMIQRIAAYVILFVATLIVGGIVNFIIGQLVKSTGLTGTDRMIGVIFGLTRGLVIVSALIILAGYTTLPQSDVWKQSMLIKQVEPAVEQVRKMLPEDISQYLQFKQQV